MAFHRHHLGRLVLQRVEPVQVAHEYLGRGYQCCHPHCHREHLACARIGAVLQQMPGPDRADGKGGGQIGGQHGVDQTVRETWVPDDVPPAGGGDKLPDIVDRIADRGLHPAVDRQYPEGRDERADRHREGGDKVQLAAHLVDPKQHHAEKSGLEEKGGQHFIGHQRADHRPGLVGEDRPVCPELVGHHDTGNDAHGEHDGKYLEPVPIEIGVDALVGLQPKGFQHREIARDADGEGGEQEMEADGEGKLYPRQIDCEILFHHLFSLARFSCCRARIFPVPGSRSGTAHPESRYS